jgi:hypothetical protein
MNDGYRHCPCRECWNKYRLKKSSAGHEIPKNRRVTETCCFCLKKHRSGILVAKNPTDHSLKCAGSHGLNAAGTGAVVAKS